MATSGSSPEISPTASEWEKEKEKEERDARGRRETIESVQDGADDEERGVGEIRAAKENRPLAVPLQSNRSRSSARSYASQGEYAPFDHGDDGIDKREEGEEVDAGPDEFEVTFDGEQDPFNPKNRPTLRKWLIVIIVASSSLCVTFASALYTSTYRQLEKDFHVSQEVATLGLTTFVCGLGLGPMFLSPLSEFYGRRNIYLCAFGMYFIWLIPCAVANNIATMLVVRFFDGLAGSAFLSVAGGTVGDMFYKHQLSAPMMIYTASPFAGPELGPVVGGFINQYTNWRW